MEKEFTSQKMHILPEMAQQMLTHNQGNIPLREARVKMFVDIINRGDWKLTTDAIGFSKEGRLLNGQHRLTACVLADKPIDCVVVTGLNDNAFMAIDVLNKLKKASDVFYLAGVSDPNVCTAIIGKAYHLNRGENSHIGAAQRITPDQLMDIYKANQNLVVKICQMADRCYKSCRVIRKSIYGGYALFLTLYLNKDFALVEEFMYALADKVRSTRSNSMDILRKRLINDKASRTRLTESNVHFLIVNAWNAYQECRFLKCLKPIETDIL